MLSFSQIQVSFQQKPGLKVNIFPSRTSASEAVADDLLTLLKQGKAISVGLATGRSVIDIYRNLTEKGQGLFDQLTTYNLDEYVGLKRGHPQSYRSTMASLLFDKLAIRASQTHFPDVHHSDLIQAARDYEHNVINAMIQWQLLGIGANGHVAFVEPGDSTPQTSLVNLHAITRERAKGDFNNNLAQVPLQAISMGLETILSAKRLRLVAFGSDKANAIRQSIEFDNPLDYPASAITKHTDSEFYLDVEAASALGIQELSAASCGQLGGQTLLAPLAMASFNLRL